MKLTVLVSGAFSAALRQVKPVYERRTGHVIASALAPSMGDSPDAVPQRLDRGEVADVVIMVGPDLRRLEAAGKVLAGSVVDLGEASIAMAVRAGADRPDITSEEGLRHALSDATSIAVSESASGAYLQGDLLDRLGLDGAVRDKMKVVTGRSIAEAVAAGDFEIGFQQYAELMPVAGVDVVGLLPQSVQQVTVIAAGVAATTVDRREAERFVSFLASEELRPLLEWDGFAAPGTSVDA